VGVGGGDVAGGGRLKVQPSKREDCCAFIDDEFALVRTVWGRTTRISSSAIGTAVAGWCSFGRTSW